MRSAHAARVPQRCSHGVAARRHLQMPAATNAQQSSQRVDRFLAVCALMLDVRSDLLPHRATRPVVCDSCILTHARRRVYAQRDDGFFVRATQRCCCLG
mmetsp:Transcript_5268/g.12660  ORF Transcript_5268/g.12660 Transcript_5268/m.12660 type:complete len:99 (+) Transcript_5268:178-474(+)